MKIEELLVEKPPKKIEGISPSSTIHEMARKLIDLRIGALVVFDSDGDMTGIVSERDLLPLVASPSSRSSDMTVAEIMTQKVITCEASDEVSYALRLMKTNSIRHIPVVRNGTLIDIVSIRELTTAYDLLRKEADTDPLTELPNRRHFLRMFEYELARAKRYQHPLVVAMVDLDHFKAINDTYGHEAGDQVLRTISGLLVNECRTIDLVGRLGGEEFAIVFPVTNVENAHLACVRLLQSIQSSIIPTGCGEIRITASIGLTGLTQKRLSCTDILRRADELLYDAKRGGRNCVVSGAE